MPNWKKVIVSGSDAVLGNITASNISASGNISASNFHGNFPGLDLQQVTTNGNVTTTSIEASSLKVNGTAGNGTFLNLSGSHTSIKPKIDFSNNVRFGNASMARISASSFAGSTKTGLSIQTYDSSTSKLQPRITIGQTGNVGIGTNDPNASRKLEVTGDISASGDIYADEYFTQESKSLSIKSNTLEFGNDPDFVGYTYGVTQTNTQTHNFSGDVTISNSKNLTVSKNIILTGDITASQFSSTLGGSISASRNLFASCSENSSVSNVALYDTSTGQFFYTASNQVGGGNSSGTNLTQSIFVTQNGNDVTGTIGDITKPFATLKSASLAATTGSTIFVYPGTYTVEANYNLAKPGLDYYFYPNTTVSKSTAGDMFDLTVFPTSEFGFNVYGYGDFILGSSAGSLLKGSTAVEFDYTFQARDIISDSTVGGANAKIVDHFTNTDFTANWEFRNMSGSNSVGFTHGANSTNGILNLTCDSIITKNACISTGNGYRAANVKAKLLKSTNSFAVLWYAGQRSTFIVDEAIGVGGDNSDLAYRFTSNGDIDILGEATGIQFGLNGGGNAFNGVCNHQGRCIHLGVEGLGALAVYNGSHVSKVDMDGDGVININWVISPNSTGDYIKQSSGKALVNILGYQNYSNLIQITGGTFIGDGCFYTRYPLQNIEVSGGTFIWKGKYDAYVNSTNYGGAAKNRRVIYQTGGTVKIQGTINLDGANFTSALPANIITYNGGKLILDGATFTTVDNAQPTPAIYPDQDRDVHIFSGGVNYNQTGSNALLAASGSGFKLTNILGGMIIEDADVE